MRKIPQNLQPTSRRLLWPRPIRRIQFHFTIYRASGSDVLIQLVETLWLRFGPYMRMLSTHVAPQIRTGESEPSGRHMAIVEALQNRDFARARDELIADITTTQDVLRPLCPE